MESPSFMRSLIPKQDEIGRVRDYGDILVNFAREVENLRRLFGESLYLLDLLLTEVGSYHNVTQDEWLLQVCNKAKQLLDNNEDVLEDQFKRMHMVERAEALGESASEQRDKTILNSYKEE